ncbi:penicillin-binding transpeptidase domain-containing protein [Solwaraspora sp. WMMD406]|uniref:penicillin-binding transpeptidase domain-containing protein n=1 Tax=Solwaraspora sp. WMMD406 TaxID=3016095 RepID=UPI002416EC5F|nr:penicillin-binding transpeptidase domain-containing protein [Solwaraspora sp. WMMD406]MDG4765334.1 penicillin-binding transpeptidase domain-containing protein [Solwaraspora sp. WMMD406]
MADRSDPPRRDPQGSRRGGSDVPGSSARTPPSGARRGGGTDGGRDGAGRNASGRDAAGLGGIADARAYTPRGRTVRESAEQRRSARTERSRDPFRPALQVLDGGRSAAGPTIDRPTPGRSADRSDADRRGTGQDRSGRSGGVRDADPRPGRSGSGGRSDRSDRIDRTDRSGRSGRSAGGPRRDRSGTGDPRGRSGSSGRRRATDTDTGRGAATRLARPPARRRKGLPRLADPRRRLRLGTFLTLTMFVVIGIRLIVLQVAEAPAYADGGVRDRVSAPVVVPAPRGSIYDRNEAILVHSVAARFVYSDPADVDDPDDTARQLSPLLGIPRSTLLERLVPQTRLDGRPSRFEWLARGVDVEVAEQVMALGLPGIGVDYDERREVPGNDLAANLLGFVGQDMNGLEGIEARYDEILRGVNGQRISETGNRELELAEIPGGYRQETEPQPGSSLVLTIDRDLQYEVQRILSGMVAQRNGSVAAAVVLDVRTGEVLAQASHPTYNAADAWSSDPTDRQDIATTFTVEPGSVHKPLVFGAALEEGLIEPDSTLDLGPTVRKGDTTFRDTRPVPAGTPTSLAGMMAYSSNVGTIALADLLGPERVYAYQEKFGLGASTAVGLPGEASGRILPVDEWSASSHGSVPLGHSVDATALQLAAAYGAIANDGVYLQPRLIREVVDADGDRTPTDAPTTRRVLSEENAAALRTIMEAVTTIPDATGTAAAIPGYRVAGKTGTGRRIVDGRPVPGEVASFIGMAPADDPRYVIAVMAHTPGGGGGDVSAPAFRDMMRFTLLHYRVPPTGTDPPAFVVHP